MSKIDKRVFDNPVETPETIEPKKVPIKRTLGTQEYKEMKNKSKVKYSPGNGFYVIE